MWLLIDFLLDVSLMTVVYIIGGVEMLLRLLVVVLEDLGVESLVLVDGLPGDDGLGVVLGLTQFLHGLVADVGRVELLVVQLEGFSDCDCLAAIDRGTLIYWLLMGDGLHVVPYLGSIMKFLFFHLHLLGSTMSLASLAMRLDLSGCGMHRLFRVLRFQMRLFAEECSC